MLNEAQSIITYSTIHVEYICIYVSLQNIVDQK